jgi:SAM-dependent methyltransferase
VTTTTPEETTAYDRVPYHGLVHPATHPDSLAVAASLCGMRPPDVERCRVLELGCGDGASLIAIAHTLPGCHAVGVDLASSARERGQATAQALGLTNVTLRVADLTALPDDLGGPFDYIVAHGLYSWVPAPVRDALLAALARLLTPNGVAYVSYNAYPAHHARQVAREIMLYAAARIPDPDERVHAARHVLATVAAARPEGEAYGMLLREEARRVENVPDQVLFHDALEPNYAPVHFHEFVAHARQHGLQFLSESEYADTAAGVMHDPRTAQAVAILMEATGGGGGAGEDERGVIDREQFADFVRGRAFRRTLLCRAGIPLLRPPDPREVFRLRVAADVTPGGEAPGGGERFRNPHGLTLTTNRPLACAALRRLGRIWPRSEPFEDLLAAAASEAGPELARLEGAPEDQRLALAASLLAAHAVNLVDFRTRDPALAPTPGDRPITSALARHQARSGADVVTGLLGASVRLEGTLARETLLRLDGTRDQATVIRQLAGLIAAGTIPPAEIGQVGDANQAEEILREAWDTKLQQLARRALLTTA